MGHAEISELEHLANSAELVAPIEYDNPEREGDVFYQFITDYGDQVGITITERRFGFMDEKRKQIYNVIVAIKNSNYPTSQRLVYGLADGLGMVFTPLFYPLIGSIGSITHDGDSLRINLPDFTGLRGLFHSDKPHEYMHAYHFLAAKDLKQRGLLPNIDGYIYLGLIEPQQKVPTKEELKKFERGFLHAMIKQETKYL